MTLSIDHLPETRRVILYALKRNGPAMIAELSSRFNISGEAVRQQLSQLEMEGWIEKYIERAAGNGGGRPASKYKLTSAGEHLFPKQYDDLSVEVLDTVAEYLGEEALKQVLLTMTEARVSDWGPRLEGLTLHERIASLKNLYLADDAFMEVEHSGEQIRLIERNCPFANVAMRRPVLCSVTVSVLTRLLGFNVVREESFQNGDGCCVFRLNMDQPVDEGSFLFGFEHEAR
jgi:predicted ArsR family transcriptional regulator